MSSNDIKAVIYEVFEDNDISLDNISADDSLMLKGIVDSMTFVNILLELEEKFNIEIDFENIDMQSIVTINSLSNTISSIIK